MAEIHKQFFDCVVYLYPSRKAANDGVRAGGTGFLIAYPSEVDGYHYYAVTNTHVIEKANAPVIRLNTKDGKTDVLEYASEDWIPHPDGDDVSVCPINLPLDAYKNNALNWNVVPMRKGLISAETHIGADVFMVGRFINQEGKQRNTPAARFGNISMIPDGPIELEEGRKEELILVEMRSHGGYSGSPVFLALPERPYEPDNCNPFPAPIPYSHIWLMGVDCGHIPDAEAVMIPNPDPSKEDEKHPQGWYIEANTNMSAVVPVWRLGELLENHEGLQMRRKTEDERRLEEQQRRERRPRFRRDAAKPTEDGGITREGFEEALRRASRKTSSQPEPEIDET
jgi:hypothetical protein